MTLLKSFYIAGDVVRLLSTLLFNSTLGIISRPRPLSYKQNLLFRILKSLRQCTVLGKKIDLHGTHTVYKKFVAKHGLPYRTTQLKVHTAQLLWLGESDAKHIVYLFHGGAYTHPAVSGHFVLMKHLIEAAAKSGSSVQIAVLKYDLAPSQQYPQQLEEAVAGLRYILEDLKYSSEQISIIGDSAGGNLALALASHLAYPHPTVSPLTLSDSQLASLILISPWVNFTNDSKSWQANLSTDYMLSYHLGKSAAAFVGKSKLDYYSQPIDAPASWWKNVPAKHIGITYGKMEVFADDIIQLGEQMKTTRPECGIIACEHEAHDQAVFNTTLGWETTTSERALTKWILDAVQST